MTASIHDVPDIPDTPDHSTGSRKFTEPVMRPPQEAHSLLLRATQGCTWNKCSFCYVSRGYPFQAVSPDQFEVQLAQNKGLFPATTPVYLTGSNPFALPVHMLKEYLARLRRFFPDFSRVSMQTCIGDIARKSHEELVELRELGIRHLYTGTENGDDSVLALMNKGHTAADVVEQLLRLDAAGITYTTFNILGMGGKGAGKACGAATARMFNQVHPARISTTGMTIFPNTPLADLVRRGEYVEASEREKIEELRVFLQTLTTDTFYDGVHYLTPLNYRLRTTDAAAKQQILEDIEDVLQTYSDEELELMVSRSRMHSL